LTAAVWALLACAVGVFAEGGYSAGPRIAFAAFAGLAVLAVRPPARVWREPMIWILLVLAVLGLVSAAWTVGLVGESVRWGLVTAGYAGVVAVSAAAAQTRTGLLGLAGGLAAIAIITAVLGLGGAALGDDAFAVRIGGDWRPAGPFEYPPALALLQVSALAPLLLGVVVLRPRYAWIAAAGLVLAAAVLVLAQSRLGLAMGLGLAGAAAVRRFRPARPVLISACVIALAVTAAAIAFGRPAGPPTDFLHGRGHLWGAAVETWADRPLAGAGADAFLTASARHQDGQTIAFAHDLPLEAAAELGIPGLLGVLALYAAGAQLLWRRRRTEAVLIFGPAVVAFGVANLVDWPWHLAGSGAVWAVAVGAIAGVAER
jgi:O-antigen ligase